MKILDIKHEVRNHFIDPESGELLATSMDVKEGKIVVESREQFSLVYATIIGALSELNGLDVKLLMYCTIHSSYNTNLIALSNPYLKYIAELYGSTPGSIRNSITRLCNKQILIKAGSGSYRINPRYFWRGTTPERERTMKYVLEVECPNC
jgi:hypothetical protein